jgi:serine/threonine-protein kinase
VAVTTEIQPGVMLADRFRVQRRLGEGGTATVFLAEDCVLCRDVAIKRLHNEGSEADVRRFRREARLGASLTHPNLVTIFDTVSGSDGVLIVMEYVRGRSLSDLIGPEGMDPRRLLEILRPVASAIDYAHEHGVVHRDVKPANVLIAEDRRVKLVDLGTATAGHLTQITAENEVMGTLAYIAPERLAGESVGEPAADVYSLAVVAFEALTGRKPHRAETPSQLLDQALHAPPPDVVEAWPEGPRRLGRVLAQGMDPNPERRQASAGALTRDLEAALSDRAGRAFPGTFAATEPMTPLVKDEPFAPLLSGRLGAESSPRRGWLLPALACICVLLAGGAWLALSQDGGEGGKATGGGRQAADRKLAGGQSTTSADQPGAGGQSTTSAATAPATPTTAAGSPPAGTVQSSSTSDASAAGAQLNEEGYSLIQEGRYDEAVPVLQRAVAAFPEGTTDINYAYALFNLGHALRMAGQPDKAIPVLERRVQIPDQTQTVQAELDAARAAAGE